MLQTPGPLPLATADSPKCSVQDATWRCGKDGVASAEWCACACLASRKAEKGLRNASQSQHAVARWLTCPKLWCAGIQRWQDPHTPSPRPSMQVSSRFPSSLGRAAPSGFGVPWLWLGLWRCFNPHGNRIQPSSLFFHASVPPAITIVAHTPSTPRPHYACPSRCCRLAAPDSTLDRKSSQFAQLRCALAQEPTRSAQDASHPLRRPSPAVDQSSPHHSVRPSSTAQHRAPAWVVEQLPVSFSASRLSKLNPSSPKGIPARDS